VLRSYKYRLDPTLAREALQVASNTAESAALAILTRQSVTGFLGSMLRVDHFEEWV
jgi:hypothetical protein